MRLYDTATRRLQELPPPPGPIRMYFCGPTVYQRIHVGNARPFVLSLWLKRWLELSGYDVRLAENITDVNDKIYAAAPGESARLAADAAGWYVDDTSDLGLGRPDVEPKATESIPPPWISKTGPRCSTAIAEHSMCQPGRPRPQGESHHVSSPSLCAFQSAKSRGSSLRAASSGSSDGLRVASSSPWRPLSLP